MMRNRVAFVAAALALPALVLAQNPPPPRQNPSATVGGKKVSVEYGQPSLNKRTIKDLLSQLPEDRVWRAGVNQVTTLTTEGDIVVGGKKLPAGRYSLYVHAPADGAWSLAINSDQGIALGKLWDKAPANMKDEPWPHYMDYQKSIAKTEVVRTPLKTSMASPAADSLTIGFTPAGNGATMTLSWGDKSWAVDVKPGS